MSSYRHIIYEGNNYDLGPGYGKPIAHISASNVGTAINAQTANQLNAVSQAVNTGVKTIEVQMTMPEVDKAIPNQHLDEINRLRKLTGVHLTLHGPMIEPTGINPQAGGWNPHDREQAERRMWSSIERGHRINPDGNIVVTLHASTSLPEPETKVKTKDGEKITQIGAINLESGQVGFLPADRMKDYLSGQKEDPNEFFKRLNEQNWSTELSNINVELSRANDMIDHALEIIPKELDREKAVKSIEEYRKLSSEQKESFKKPVAGNVSPGDILDASVEYLKRGDIYLRDVSNNLRERFNRVYERADSEQKKKLDEYAKKWREAVESSRGKSGHIEDYSKLKSVASVMSEGLDLLGSMKPPERIKPIKDFALDQASETFSNLAIKGFKKFGADKAPILSLENHPAGPYAGFYRAKDMKALIEKSRDKFIEKAKKEGLSEKEAKQSAEKLIGATWDVGHINMIRQFGYTDEDLKKEAKTLAPYIKHVHLSDNFGFEHSELPMGMGNVPMEEYEKLFKKYGKKVEEIKRIVEAGDWIQQFQGASPLPQTFQNFGSPLYSMEAAPYWNQAYGTSGGYYSGLGNTLPDIHFSQLYGAGFQNLPVDLGGQMAGTSRMSGNPMT